MGLRERFHNMTKGRKIFISTSIVLGIIAIAGFLLAVIGKTYDYTTLSLVGFILLLPFLILMAGVLVSYARV